MSVKIVLTFVLGNDATPKGCHSEAEVVEHFKNLLAETEDREELVQWLIDVKPLTTSVEASTDSAEAHVMLAKMEHHASADEDDDDDEENGDIPGVE